jgi:CheY-like chemotaxis protein
MLVEDDDAVRSLANHLLCDAGYTVIQAKNGLEALQVFSSEKPQLGLLLTDVIMPEMGGKDLADRLSTLAPEIAIMFMSGYSGEGTLLQGFDQEKAHFIQKPFLPGELLQRVHTVLKHRAQAT